MLNIFTKKLLKLHYKMALKDKLCSDKRKNFYFDYMSKKNGQKGNHYSIFRQKNLPMLPRNYAL